MAADGTDAAPAAPGSSLGRTYWVCKKCPDECTVKCFKTWKVWAYDLQGCKDRLMEHLTGSGKHADARPAENAGQHYQQCVDGAEYEEII